MSNDPFFDRQILIASFQGRNSKQNSLTQIPAPQKACSYDRRDLRNFIRSDARHNSARFRSDLAFARKDSNLSFHKYVPNSCHSPVNGIDIALSNSAKTINLIFHCPIRDGHIGNASLHPMSAGTRTLNKHPP